MPRHQPGRGRGRQGDSAAGESLRQHPPRPGQPARHRPFRAPEVPGRVLAGAAFDVAQDDHRAIVVRQPAQLLVEDAAQVAPVRRRAGLGFRHHRDLPFPGRSLEVPDPDAHGRLAGDPVEPVADQLPGRDRRPPSGPAPGRWPGRRPRRPGGAGAPARHTPRTIGPCRRTSASKAAASRRSMNSVRSAPSDRPAAARVAAEWRRRPTTPFRASVLMRVPGGTSGLRPLFPVPLRIHPRVCHTPPSRRERGRCSGRIGPAARPFPADPSG